MATPTTGDVHVNRPLTQISVAYIQKATNFVATRVFPNVPVTNKSDNYYQFDRGKMMRDEMQERAPGAESSGSGFDVDSTPTYTARVYAHHHDIPDQLRGNTDQQIPYEKVATHVVTQKGLIKREKLWVSKYFKTGIWTGDLDGVTGAPGANQFKRWDVAGSTPIQDIQTHRIKIAERTGGYMPNKLVLSPYVVLALQNHADVLDRVKYTQRGVITLELLASLFDVDEVLVPFGVENTAADGATATFSFIMGKHALLAYAAPTPSIMEPSAGYTFSWTGLMGSAPDGQRIKKFRMEEKESDRVEIQMSFDQKLVAADCATFFEDAVS